MTRTGQDTRWRERARLLLVELALERGQHERLGCRLEPPADRVVERLGRVRLGEHLAEEELEEVAVVRQPVVAVVLLPALVGLARRIPVERVARRDDPAERHGRADEDGGLDAVRVVGREQQRSLRAEREGDEHRLLGLGGVHDRQCVEREVGLGVARLGPVRSPVPAPVHHQHPAVPRQVRDLHLPVARVDDRPRRHQEDRRLARAVHLPVQAHAFALDVAGLVGVHRPRLLSGNG